MKRKRFDDYIKTRFSPEELDEIEKNAQKKADLLRALSDKDNESMMVEMKMSIPLYNFMKNLAEIEDILITDYIGSLLIENALDNVDTDIAEQILKEFEKNYE